MWLKSFIYFRFVSRPSFLTVRLFTACTKLLRNVCLVCARSSRIFICFTSRIFCLLFGWGVEEKTLRNYVVHNSYHSINITFAYVNHFAFRKKYLQTRFCSQIEANISFWREMRWNRAARVARLDVLIMK